MICRQTNDLQRLKRGWLTEHPHEANCLKIPQNLKSHWQPLEKWWFWGIPAVKRGARGKSRLTAGTGPRRLQDRYYVITKNSQPELFHTLSCLTIHAPLLFDLLLSSSWQRNRQEEDADSLMASYCANNIPQHWDNVWCPSKHEMLTQRRANINTTLGTRFLFAGVICQFICSYSHNYHDFFSAVTF